MKNNDVKTLLNIMDMGNQHKCYADERNWLVRVLYAVPTHSAVKPLAIRWLMTIKERWAYEFEYFMIRDEVRNEAAALVHVLAAKDLVAMKARKQALENELKDVNNRIGRFDKWQ